MEKSIRQLQGEEMLESLYALNSYSLHPSPPLQNKEEWLNLVRARQGIVCMAVYEDESPVAIAVSTPMTQNMRGKLFTASGIWGVSTTPGSRRMGYCREAMASLLSAEHEAGKVFSNLYPFRESFYERLGYVAYPLVKIARFPAVSLSPLLKVELGGHIRQQYIGEIYDEYRAYLAEMRKDTHGMVMFDFPDRASATRNLFWAAMAMFDGSVEGLMLYRLLGEEVTKYEFSALRFYYRTSRARYLLLNWIARHIDQAERVELWLPPFEYPETWLSDSQMKIESAIRPAMSRVLDVEKIDGMEVGEGRFSAQVIDPLCPWNEGIWAFEGNDGKLCISKASRADCRMTIQGLTALIAGVHDPQDLPLRGWGDPDENLQSGLRQLFSRMNPFMHELF
ncbi:MAG: enhanced intracellular survival protein Eis [Acidobacteriaceae bacterium]